MEGVIQAPVEWGVSLCLRSQRERPYQGSGAVVSTGTFFQVGNQLPELFGLQINPPGRHD